MDISDCRQKGFIKKTKIDTELVKSLVEMSNIKEITVSTADINEINISAYVSLAYDSLREIMEAICVMHGYKVLSHLCLGELFKTLISDFDYTGFDRLRYIRNGINYYGTKIDFSQGKELIEKTFLMKKDLLNKHLSGLSK